MSLGFGIIGLGARAEKHAEAIAAVKGCSLRAVCSRSLDKAKEFASRHGSPRCYDEVEYLIEDHTIDIIVITTPTMNHLEPALLAIRSGRSVIVETPAEISSERAEELITAAEEEGVFISFASDIPYKEIERIRKLNPEKIEIALNKYHPKSYFESSSWKEQRIMMNEGYLALVFLLYLSDGCDGFSLEEKDDGSAECHLASSSIQASMEKGNEMVISSKGKAITKFEGTSLTPFYLEFYNQLETGMDSVIPLSLFVKAIRLISG